MHETILVDAINSNIHSTRKPNRSGFSINCPMCLSYGQPRADTKHRCGIKFEYDGSVIINCFNCRFSCGWKVGRLLSRKMKHFLGNIGLGDMEIKSLNFNIWKLSLKEEYVKDTPTEEFNFSLNFEIKELPEKSLTIQTWKKYGCSDRDFLDVYQYIEDRSPHLLNSFDFYWSPLTEHSLNRRFLIPFYQGDKLVGWSSRIIDNVDGSRYYTDAPSHFVFNNNVLDLDRKYVVVTEGLMDALSINGVAMQGAKISKEQAFWLRGSNKEVIVVPDLDRDGKEMVDIAVEHGFSVSIPTWMGNEANDIDDAVRKFGYPYTVKEIIKNATNNKLRIKILKNRIA